MHITWDNEYEDDQHMKDTEESKLVLVCAHG